MINASETQIWDAFLGTVTLLLGLVTILYNTINKDTQANTDQLAAGAETFRKIGTTLVEFSERIKVLERTGGESDEDAEEIREEIKKMHDQLLILARECHRQHGTNV